MKVKKFKGYTSIYNIVDKDNDIVKKNAFGKKFKKVNIPFLWQHDQNFPIGKITKIKTDKKGLWVEGIFIFTGKGKEAYCLYKMGAIKGLSIGFIATNTEEKKDGIRLIKKAELNEVSLVTFPSNEKCFIEFSE